MRRQLALLVLATAACGGEAEVPAGPPTAALKVGLQEYDFALSAGALEPGEVTVMVTNAGSAGHDVRLRQGDRVLGASEVLAPGGRQQLRVQVTSGTPVQLDCTVRGHVEAGMVATLAVAG